MEKVIKGVAGLDVTDKVVLRNMFHTGFISDIRYKETEDYWKSFKVYIEHKLPKNSSKVPGIDFVDIRKDDEGYYMIIGEVRTTGNGYSSKLPEILDSFTNRIDKTFSEMYQQIKENDDGSNAEYTIFLQEMLGVFYRITGDSGKKKRVSGTIN